MTIWTVTLNPSLDKTLSVSQLYLGELNRVRVLRYDLSGKGLNVSRALRALGVDSQVIAFVGGATGDKLRRGLAEAGFAAHLIKVDEETRQNVTLLDESTGQYTKINEPGAGIEPAHVQAMLALVERVAGPGDLWAFCGALPPGAPADLYAQLIQLVQGRGGKAFLDSSGAALREGVAAVPYAIKPNAEETAELLDVPLDSLDACREAVQCFLARGIRLVALTRGAKGLLLGAGDRVLTATPPPVEARSPIGAGDATVAGLLWAVSEGCNAVEIARRAVACGTATAMQEGTGIGERATVEQLVKQVEVE